MIRSLLIGVVLAGSVAGQDASSEAPHSLFTTPLFLADQPPECRAVAVILISTASRTADEALAQARALARRVRGGESFTALARAHSEGPEGVAGGVLGALAPGALEEGPDRFLFAAELGEVSEPMPTERGITLWQRTERWAACEYVLFTGEESRARAVALAARLEAGSALEPPVGGRIQRAVFERGPNDRLLKLAAFQAASGSVIGPLETPLGVVTGRRVTLDDVPESERENHWIRARALVVLNRDQPSLAVRERIDALHARIEAGADLAALARANTEEPTARARAGDLGWIHRFHPSRSRLLDGLYVVEPGTVGPPLAFRGGWVVLERTR